MPEGDNPLGHSFNDGTIRFYFAFAGICTAGCFTAGSFFGTITKETKRRWNSGNFCKRINMW